MNLQQDGHHDTHQRFWEIINDLKAGDYSSFVPLVSKRWVEHSQTAFVLHHQENLKLDI